MNNLKKTLVAGAMAGTALIGGAVGASLLGTAGAQTSDGSSTSAASTDTDSSTAPHGPHTANGITEQELTGDDASKAIAAAQAAVPGGTVERAETDAEGAAYEVHMTKSDGSEVTVKLDNSFNVTDTLTGRG